MEFAIAPLTLHRPEPLDLITTAAAAGYDLVGIQLAHDVQGVSPLVRDPDFLAATKQALSSGGIEMLEISNVVLDSNFLLENARALVEFAYEVGARVVQAVGWDDNTERAVENLAATADIAAEWGLVVAVEFLPYASTRTLGDAVALVEATGRPNAKIFLDSLHFFRSGGSVEDLRTVNPALFYVIQLSDASREPADPAQLRVEAVNDRFLLGTGGLPLREFLAALPTDLPYSLEIPCRSLKDLSLVEQARAVLVSSQQFLSSQPPSTAR